MKKKYRIRNWPEYNKVLVNSGSLTVWIDEKSTTKWHNVHILICSAVLMIILILLFYVALTFHNLFHFLLRATGGFGLKLELSCQ